MSRFFLNKDLNLVGRQDGMFECFVFRPGSGWEEDTEHVLMDRLIGYDEDTIGSTDMLSRIEKITEQDAMRAIMRAEPLPAI